MACSQRLVAAICLHLLVAVEGSWFPAPLSRFAAGPPAVGAPPGTQRFRHEEHSVRKDGSALHLNWEVHAEPESVLALDWEHQNGIALLECQRGRLVLRLPREHAARAPSWRFLTASGRHHGCKHLGGRHLYHRLLRVAAREPAGEAEALTFETQELASPAELFPRCHFAVALTPPPADRNSPASRRLMQDGPLEELEHILESRPEPAYNWTWNYSFAPEMPLKQDFHTGHTPEDSMYSHKFDARKLDVTVGMVINYTSSKDSDLADPKVHFEGDLDLLMDIDMMLAEAVHFPRQGGVDSMYTQPFTIDLIHLLPPSSIPGKLQIPFFFGPVPMTLEPSIDQFKIAVKHAGSLDGSMQTAVKTQLISKSRAVFDSEKGLSVNTHNAFKDSKILPPMTAVSMSKFKIGMRLRADAAIKPLFNASVRPQLNISLDLAERSGPVNPLFGSGSSGGGKCAPRDIIAKVEARVLAKSSMSPLTEVFADEMDGPIGELLPGEICTTGACQATRPGCSRPDVSPLSMKRMVITISRKWKAERLGADFEEQLAYALGLLPELVKVVGGDFSNGTKRDLLLSEVEGKAAREADSELGGLAEEYQHAEKTGFEDANKELDEAMGKLTGELDDLLAEMHSVHHRRLGAAKDGSGHQSIVVKVTESPGHEITDELLARLTRADAFWLRDGNEKALGTTRVLAARLLKEPAGRATLRGGQQLWGEAAPPLRGSFATTRVARVAALMGLASLVAGAAWALRRRRRGAALATAEFQAVSGVE